MTLCGACGSVRTPQSHGAAGTPGYEKGVGRGYPRLDAWAVPGWCMTLCGACGSVRTRYFDPEVVMDASHRVDGRIGHGHQELTVSSSSGSGPGIDGVRRSRRLETWATACW